MSRVAILHEVSPDHAVVTRITRLIESAGHTAVFPSEAPRLGATIAESILDAIHQSDLIVVVISKGNPNIYYELGILYSFNKPSLLMVNDQVSLPSDLVGIQYLKYDDRSLRGDTFDYKFLQNFRNLLSKPTSFMRHGSNLLEHRIFKFSDGPHSTGAYGGIARILEQNVQPREIAFENWLRDLASDVNEWEVVSRTQGGDQGYDLAVWNNIQDSVLSALGNPIIFELKTSPRLDADQIIQMLNTAKRAGVKGFVLLTLAELSRGTIEKIKTVYDREKIVPVVLDRSDLLQIRSAQDLVEGIRRKASILLQSGASGV